MVLLENSSDQEVKAWRRERGRRCFCSPAKLDCAEDEESGQWKRFSLPHILLLIPDPCCHPAAFPSAPLGLSSFDPSVLVGWRWTSGIASLFSGYGKTRQKRAGSLSRRVCLDCASVRIAESPRACPGPLWGSGSATPAVAVAVADLGGAGAQPYLCQTQLARTKSTFGWCSRPGLVLLRDLCWGDGELWAGQEWAKPG